MVSWWRYRTWLYRSPSAGRFGIHLLIEKQLGIDRENFHAARVFRPLISIHKQCGCAVDGGPRWLWQPRFSTTESLNISSRNWSGSMPSSGTRDSHSSGDPGRRAPRIRCPPIGVSRLWGLLWRKQPVLKFWNFPCIPAASMAWSRMDYHGRILEGTISEHNAYIIRVKRRSKDRFELGAVGHCVLYSIKVTGASTG